MIRVWNYNKSRAHSYRGVRRVRILLDDTIIFEGDVAKAPGVVDVAEACSEVILFTFDEDILAKIEESDRQAGYIRMEETREMNPLAMKRPGTGERSRPTSSLEGERGAGGEEQGLAAKDTDSKASGGSEVDEVELALRDLGVTSTDTTTNSTKGGDGSSSLVKPGVKLEDRRLIRAKKLEVHIESTWGDTDYVGLKAIQVLVGPNLTPLNLRPSQINCLPARDMRSLGYSQEARVLDNLVKAPNTSSGWILPRAVASRPMLTLDLGGEQLVGALAVWNYCNAQSWSPEEDALRGVKSMSVVADGKEIGRYTLRKGPGNGSIVDYGQLVYLMPWDQDLQYLLPPSSNASTVTYVSPPVKQDYETPLHPTGLLLTLSIHCTWGDPYYVGLEGLQVFGPKGMEIPIDPAKVRYRLATFSLHPSI